MTGLLTAIGVATPAGLNAYMVLLIVGLAARVAGRVVLPPGLEWLANTWVLVALGAALTAEIFVAKVPQFARSSDRIGVVVRPIAGAMVAVACTAAMGFDPLGAAVIGAGCAGTVHFLKATIRPRISEATGGLAVPLVSLLEDLLAATGAVLAIVAPVAGAVVAVSIVVALGVLLVLLRRPSTTAPRPEPPEAAPPPGV